MTFDDIVNAAREKTGLPDPDSDSWREGLEILLRDHVREDLLTVVRGALQPDQLWVYVHDADPARGAER